MSVTSMCNIILLMTDPIPVEKEEKGAGGGGGGGWSQTVTELRKSLL